MDSSDGLNGHIKNIAGQRFGKWFVLSYCGFIDNHSYWLCRCDCGTEAKVRSDGLTCGVSKSCGCYQKEVAGRIRAELNKEQALPFGVANFRDMLRKYKQGAKKRGISFELSDEEFSKLLSGNCFYCGAEPSMYYPSVKTNGHNLSNGIDRVDPSRGYIANNCVSCCKRCNYAKRDMTLDDFYAWINRVITHRDLVNGICTPAGPEWAVTTA